MCLDGCIRFKCSRSLHIIPIKSLEVKEVKTLYMHTQNQSAWIYEHIYILITSTCNIFYHHMAHAVATCWLQYLNNLSFRSWPFLTSTLEAPLYVQVIWNPSKMFYIFAFQHNEQDELYMYLHNKTEQRRTADGSDEDWHYAVLWIGRFFLDKRPNHNRDIERAYKQLIPQNYSTTGNKWDLRTEIWGIMWYYPWTCNQSHWCSLVYDIHIHRH